MNSAQKHSRLWLALRLQKLTLEALNIDDDEQKPLVVTDKQRVIYLNNAAQKAGVMVGMDVTTAQLLSNCESYTRDRIAEKKVLNELSAQLYQFTPYLETYECEYQPYSGLLLEISSCLLLFEGMPNLVTAIFKSLNDMGYSFEYGLAHAAKAAWLLSFNDQNIIGNQNKDGFIEQLKLLPIHLLHDFPSTIDALQKTGFKTLGDIARQIDSQKITSIKKRFGEKFSEYLCDLFGVEQNLQQVSLFTKPLPNYKPAEFFSENIQFDYPITQNDHLYYPVESLLHNLSNYLRKHQLECQHIEWILSDIYRNKFSINVHSDTPESHWQLLYDLTLIQLDNRELPFEVDSLTLSCTRTQAVQNRTQLLSFSQKKARGTTRNFTITMAKLKARLGEKAIYKLSYQDALLPEEIHSKIAINEVSNQQLPTVHKKSPRPAWLLSPPVFIEERKQSLYWRGKLTLLSGPERINANWWEKPTARDYFVAQRHDYLRLWIFFDLHQKTWHVHGIFA